MAKLQIKSISFNCYEEGYILYSFELALEDPENILKWLDCSLEYDKATDSIKWRKRIELPVNYNIDAILKIEEEIKTIILKFAKHCKSISNSTKKMKYLSF
ncbi:MAG: hypothetical protein A2Y62_04315 [Candidatus Fischerbacteria bacterium RBG_13_37_8]|uniref:Uncharacterized protein n=1 Tax=Candidatus Fischerbacteria bacterium RBG_13_37_8 TaxID=1817863 RepID=A0A1F5VFV8_9BACT|nr:MAG: hypothetical protein A2Y62_04315 [Candidatus Fischerbacteria bacterium RBG_13_37_8]